MKHCVLLALVACGSVDVVPPDASVDATADVDAAVEVDAGEIDAGPQPTAACAIDPAQCLYTPTTYPYEMIELTAKDPDRVGGERAINVAIRYSRSAPQPMPIVVWSHGGAQGQMNAATALEEWAIAAAEAGYVSVAIAHSPRSNDQRIALCEHLGLDQAGCATFKVLGYDRPLDISIVIDRLTASSTVPQLAGVMDIQKIAVGGHSAGAGGTLMVAGAPREVNGAPLLLKDPRPIAFLALSPQAPGSDGMTDTGYAQITRPTLIGTGRGDENPPDTADGRASVFDLVQPGNKARIFVEDPAAVHTVFALETAGCANAAPLAHCEEMISWVKSAGLAFLDAHLRTAPDAIAWMAATNLAVASGGAAEWSVR
jgi:hypothetical protein